MATRLVNRRPSSGHRGKTGRLVWEAFDIDPVTVVQNGQSVADLSAGIVSEIRSGSTVMRIVGDWGMHVDADDSLTSIMSAIYMLPGEQLRASAFPELQSEEYAPLWRKQLNSRTGQRLTSADIWVPDHFDIKVKRKFRFQDQALVFHIENTSAGAFDATVLFTLRFLLKVP